MPYYIKAMAVLLPTWLLSVTFTNSVTLGSVFILAMGIGFAGYFGYRDKSWRISSEGWKEAFEFQLQENKKNIEEIKKLANRVTELQRALEIEQAKPQFSDLVLTISESIKGAEARQNQIIELLSRLLQPNPPVAP